MSRQQSDALVTAIAHPQRRAILDDLLEHGERTVGQLVEALGGSWSATSQHLTVLASAGLVVADARGRERWYRPTLEPLEELVDWMLQARSVWATHPDRLGAFLDRTGAVTAAPAATTTREETPS